MINVEVVFDGDEIHLNGYKVIPDLMLNCIFVFIDDDCYGLHDITKSIKEVGSIEEAIKFCLENQNAG